MLLKEAKRLTGGLSAPSKMPGYAYNIPAWECNQGGKLRDVAGSVCSDCYALKGRYRFQNVETAMYHRLNCMLHEKRWGLGMVVLINHYSPDYFRWFDSGDLQSVAMLRQIVGVCNNTPKTKHWLPTREYNIVGAFLRDGGEIPANLCIRLSAHMIDQKPPTALAKTFGVTASGVFTSGFSCPASNQGNECGLCRDCWNPRKKTVTYKKH